MKKSKPDFSLLELIERIGEKNLKIQFLQATTTRYAMKKKGWEITFPPIVNPAEVADGKLKNCGLVVWLPTDLLEKARQELEENRPNSKIKVSGWKQLKDAKPSKNERVLFATKRYQSKKAVEAYYRAEDDLWDHDNWHGPIFAHPDDWWISVPSLPKEFL